MATVALSSILRLDNCFDDRERIIQLEHVESVFLDLLERLKQAKITSHTANLVETKEEVSEILSTDPIVDQKIPLESLTGEKGEENEPVSDTSTSDVVVIEIKKIEAKEVTKRKDPLPLILLFEDPSKDEKTEACADQPQEDETMNIPTPPPLPPRSPSCTLSRKTATQMQMESLKEQLRLLSEQREKELKEMAHEFGVSQVDLAAFEELNMETSHAPPPPPPPPSFTSPPPPPPPPSTKSTLMAPPMTSSDGQHIDPGQSSSDLSQQLRMGTLRLRPAGAQKPRIIKEEKKDLQSVLQSKLLEFRDRFAGFHVEEPEQEDCLKKVDLFEWINVSRLLSHQYLSLLNERESAGSVCFLVVTTAQNGSTESLHECRKIVKRKEINGKCSADT
ncbi:viral capsid associated protein [Planoprotostelium fungivorum]|uniref:Viral capsid associated protein n=1 Tax=Planoprotostelium fungivorum TaxID=1890364 RepID=A0A2P6NBM7_9EUKA|nr:viral capsid associated protein [Planoprotostelium fungivorum]